VSRHSAVAEEAADPFAQAGIEDGHHQPQVGIEFLGAQRRVEIAQVVLVQYGERASGLQLRAMEGALVQFGALDDPHAREARDSRAVPVLRGRQDDRYPLAVPDGEFLDHP